MFIPLLYCTPFHLCNVDFNCSKYGVVIGFFLWCCSVIFVAGQEHKSGLVFSTTPRVEVQDNPIFTVVMQIENQTQDTIHAYLKMHLPSGIRQLNQEVMKISLNPSKKAFIPLKFSAQKTLSAGKSELRFELIEASGQILSNSITEINMLSKRSVKIFPQIPTVFFHQEGDSVRYELRVLNHGNETESVLINNVIPNFRGGYNTQNFRVEVKAFEEKTLKFSHYVDRDMIGTEMFYANISAYYQNGDHLGNAIFLLKNASSKRHYVDPQRMNSHWSQYSSNSVNMSLRDIGGQNPNYNFFAHHDFSVGMNELAYHLNYTYWENSTTNLLTDSWVRYQHKNTGFQLGSITNNDFDIPINGRGATLYHNNPEKESYLRVGAVEKNYNLLETLSTESIKNNYTAFAQSRFKLKSNQYIQSAAVYDYNYENTNFIWSNQYQWNSKNDWRYLVRGSYGYTQFNANQEAEHSTLIAANVSGRIKKLEIYSSNYYSSGHYPGTRRGALYLNQRLQHSFDHFSVWTNLTYSHSNPKTLNTALELYSQSNQSTSFREELGLSFRVSQQSNLAISQKYTYEDTHYFEVENFQYLPISFQAVYMNGMISWLSKSRNHQVVFNTSNGIFTGGSNAAWKPLSYTQLNWNYKNFQLNTSFQLGSTMVSELYLNQNIEEDVLKYSLAASYRKSFFRNKLNVDLQTYYNYNQNLGHNINLGGFIEYEPIDHLSVNFLMNYNTFETSFRVNKQSYIQTGIKYLLPPKNEPSLVKKGNVLIKVYYDQNGNGLFDEGDVWANDRMVNINEATFLTDKSGAINYQKVPYGAYKIEVPGQKWYAKIYDIQHVNQQTIIEIPMYRTGTLRGKLQYEQVSRLEYQVPIHLA